MLSPTPWIEEVRPGGDARVRLEGGERGRTTQVVLVPMGDLGETPFGRGQERVGDLESGHRAGIVGPDPLLEPGRVRGSAQHVLVEAGDEAGGRPAVDLEILVGRQDRRMDFGDALGPGDERRNPGGRRRVALTVRPPAVTAL